MTTAVPEVIARFQFQPNSRAAFVWSDVPGDNLPSFVEMSFDTVDEVIELCEEFRKDIIDVTARVKTSNEHYEVLHLSSFPLNDE